MRAGSAPAERRRRLSRANHAFGVYCPQNQIVYLVPIERVPCITLGTLRVEPPRNGQTHNIRWARDYELILNR